MIIYEVNIQLCKTSLQEEVERWLKEHASEMLEFDGFTKYNIYEEHDSGSTRNYKYVVHYHIKGIKNLYDYIENYSRVMRIKGIDKFGDQIIITDRRILENL